MTARGVSARNGSDDREHPVALEGGDLAAVLLPLRTLVAEEELIDVLAERLGEQLGVLGDLDRVVQVLGQLLESEGLALAVVERPDVVLGLARELVLLLESLHAG